MTTTDPQRQLELIYQAFLRWGDIPELQAVLREADPAELAALLRAAKRLELIGEPETVRKRTDRLIVMIEAHERWESRFADLRAVTKIFGVVGGTMTAVWVLLREPLMELLRWWLK